MSEFFSITNEALHKLLACVLFRGFEKAELPELLEKLRAKEINRKKGEFFFHEGEPAERVGILLSGEAQVVRDDYDGSRSVLSDLKEGDIINSFDGIAINTMNDLKEFIYKKKPGDTVVLQISRGKINKEISIVLGKK